MGVRESGIREFIADYENGKRPPTTHIVTVNKVNQMNDETERRGSAALRCCRRFRMAY